jgi:hypothetical protein
MPYKPDSETAVHALDPLQQLAANKQYSWLSGADVSLSSSTSAIETTTTPGAVVFNGETISIESVTRGHPDGDTDDPRWDAVCVTDRTGTVEVFTGIPAPTVTDENGDPIRGEPAFSPAPSDNITSEMVCLALVWIPAGATTNDDLTDETNGGVANPVVDRRVYQAGRVDQTTRRATITSTGWYRIASIAPLGTGPAGGDRASGLFTVRDTQSGRHSSLTFEASVHYGDRPTLTVHNTSSFAGSRAINAVRIVSSGTDDGAAVDINVQLGDRSQIDFAEYTLQNNYHYGGWSPEQWPSASVPSGYSTTAIDLKDPDPLLGAVRGGDYGSGLPWAVLSDGSIRTTDLGRRNVATKVTLSANQSIPDATPTEIEFDQTAFDDYNAFSGETTITVPTDGTYLCDTNIGFADLSADSFARIDVKKNNTLISTDRAKPYEGGVALSTNTVSKLSAGDSIAVRVYHTNGSATDVRSSRPETFLTIARLG